MADTSILFIIIMYNHHGSGGSCAVSGDYISAAQHILIARSLSQPVLV